MTYINSHYIFIKLPLYPNFFLLSSTNNLVNLISFTKVTSSQTKDELYE